VNTSVRVIPLIGICLLAQACTGTPAYMEHPKPKVTTGSTAQQNHRVVLEDNTLTNQEVTQIFAMGYKPVARHDQVYYCRREVPTGSRFDQLTCRTGDEVKRLTQASRDATTQFQGTGGCRSIDRPGAC